MDSFVITLKNMAFPLSTQNFTIEVGVKKYRMVPKEEGVEYKLKDDNIKENYSVASNNTIKDNSLLGSYNLLDKKFTFSLAMRSDVFYIYVVINDGAKHTYGFQCLVKDL